MSQTSLSSLENAGEFIARHIGISPEDEQHMLSVIGEASRQALIDSIVPRSIARGSAMQLLPATTEAAALAELKAIAQKNQIFRSFIGQGYYGTHIPGVILRNILENPAWYTAYTPYQAEISQGRMEALVNFQTMITDLTGMPIANASMLDEATAAAEAMTLAKRSVKAKGNVMIVSGDVHPQTIEVLQTRAAPLGLQVQLVQSHEEWVQALAQDDYFAALVQYPASSGWVHDWSDDVATVHGKQAAFIMAADLLALTLLKAPGEMDADIVVGTTQRFGMPMGAGGPHAGYLACRDSYKRSMSGRLVGVSVDGHGDPAYRLALQTREQHIRRDKATSNICTAQALLANMAAFYAMWHGPRGLKRIALRTHAMARLVVEASGLQPAHAHYFDTMVFESSAAEADERIARAATRRINLRRLERDDGRAAVAVAFDETVDPNDVAEVCWALTGRPCNATEVLRLCEKLPAESPVLTGALRRQDAVLTHPVFSRYRSETDFTRYLKKLENRDISLVHSMIPLGSCTMKLNAAAEMAPITWPTLAAIHPHVPSSQCAGYRRMIHELGAWLANITGFDAVSFQSNSGAQGEYAGLLAIRPYLAANDQGHRDVCLIPASAHGTNPASAQMMGMRIVVVACDENGNIDMPDLARQIAQHRDHIAALMVTYPSTHGVFEATIRDVCRQVHDAGGLVYMDGANLNAQCGLTHPALIGADVCHLNLHKTFCIPHGGGGPGVGPIAAGGPANDPVSAAAHGSALILAISWMYVRMMGASGLREATTVAILNANYIAARLSAHYDVLYTGANGRVAHECILDLRHFKAKYGISAEDVAKRLMDFGFHAPTLSFPVADTLMVEPTESESQGELDRFCEAMIAIRDEIMAVEQGRLDKLDNPLKNAPHTATEIAGDWQHSYSREMAAYPLAWVRDAKVWPAVKRIDNVGGDRNLICTCPPMSDYVDEAREKAYQ